MQICAIERIVETTERNIETTETVYLVRPQETVEELLARMAVDGKSTWHYRDFSVVLKLVKDGQEVVGLTWQDRSEPC